MKIYNKSKYPDDIIKPVLLLAGRKARAKTSNVVIKLTQKREQPFGCSGSALNYTSVAKWLLDTRARRKDGEYKTQYVNCDGFIKLSLPSLDHHRTDVFNFDFLGIAETIYEVAIHEFAHVRDYQKNVYYDRRHERRKHHDNRAWEKVAARAANKGVKNTKNNEQDCIIDLAIFIEKGV